MSFLGLVLQWFLWSESCDVFAKSPKNESPAKVVEIAKHPALKGDVVPDFQLRDHRGKLFSLSQFKGYVVFLNFWASWCPPCVWEIPAMEVLNRRLKAKKFVMIAISVDDSWAEISSFFQERGGYPNFLVLSDSTKDVSNHLFGTSKFPETFIIGPDGRLLRKYIGAYDWQSADKLSEMDAFLLEKTE